MRADAEKTQREVRGVLVMQRIPRLQIYRERMIHIELLFNVRRVNSSILANAGKTVNIYGEESL